MEMPVERMEKSMDEKENIVSLVRRAEAYSARLEELKEKAGEETYEDISGNG